MKKDGVSEAKWNDWLITNLQLEIITSMMITQWNTAHTELNAKRVTVHTTSTRSLHHNKIVYSQHRTGFGGLPPSSAMRRENVKIFDDYFALEKFSQPWLFDVRTGWRAAPVPAEIIFFRSYKTRSTALKNALQRQNEVWSLKIFVFHLDEWWICSY